VGSLSKLHKTSLLMLGTLHHTGVLDFVVTETNPSVVQFLPLSKIFAGKYTWMPRMRLLASNFITNGGPTFMWADFIYAICFLHLC
jgi:hypothetical protein